MIILIRVYIIHDDRLTTRSRFLRHPLLKYSPHPLMLRACAGVRVHASGAPNRALVCVCEYFAILLANYRTIYIYTLYAYYRRRRRRRRAVPVSRPRTARARQSSREFGQVHTRVSLPRSPDPPVSRRRTPRNYVKNSRSTTIVTFHGGASSAEVEFANGRPTIYRHAEYTLLPPVTYDTCSHHTICPPKIIIYLYLAGYLYPLHRMTPTIQCFEDQSMQIPPASVLYNNLFFQENHHQLTSASDRTNSRPDVRTNHQWIPCLRNRNSTFSSKRNTSYASALKPDDMKRLLRRDNGSSSSSDTVAEATITEEHLNAIRKRQALLLVTIQTMTLFHHNQILEHKLSALHRKVLQFQNRQRQKNIRSAAAEE